MDLLHAVNAALRRRNQVVTSAPGKVPDKWRGQPLGAYVLRRLNGHILAGCVDLDDLARRLGVAA